MGDPNVARGLMGGSTGRTLEAMLKLQKAELTEQSVAQDVSEDAMANRTQEAVNPFSHKMGRKRKSMTERKSRLQKAQKAKKAGGRMIPPGKLKELAEQKEHSNSELRSKVLLALRDALEEGDDKEAVMSKLSRFYKDVSLQDDALDFLEQATTGEMQEAVKEAREELQQTWGREIKAGYNIASQARAFSEKGLGTTTGLRDMYRDITGNPRDSQSLFNELSNQFPYKDLKQVIKFLFHSLGTDLKSQGPSIPHGQLHRLLSQVRVLQAILGVYTFFKGRMRLMHRLFSRSDIPFPKELTFETMSKEFMKLCGERYPTPDKAMQATRRLKVDDLAMAKIISLSQMRDAVREVALFQIYKSVQHRNDLNTAIIEALENCEDELEDEMAEYEEDEIEEGEI